MKKPPSCQKRAAKQKAAPKAKAKAAFKKPAASVASKKVKATKYCYHKEQTWGFKMNGKEFATVGVSK